jgi:hypothetical protein
MPRIFSSLHQLKNWNGTLPVGRGQVGAGATYDYYDHHMDRTTLRLVPGEFGEWCNPGLLRHPVMSVVKPDFREQADLGLGFSRCLVDWDSPKLG